VIDEGEERRARQLLFDLLQDDGGRPYSLVLPSRNIANFVGTYPAH